MDADQRLLSHSSLATNRKYNRFGSVEAKRSVSPSARVGVVLICLAFKFVPFRRQARMHRLVSPDAALVVDPAGARLCLSASAS